MEKNLLVFLWVFFLPPLVLRVPVSVSESVYTVWHSRTGAPLQGIPVQGFAPAEIAFRYC